MPPFKSVTQEDEERKKKGEGGGREGERRRRVGCKFPEKQVIAMGLL